MFFKYTFYELFFLLFNIINSVKYKKNAVRKLSPYVTSYSAQIWYKSSFFWLPDVSPFTLHYICVDALVCYWFFSYILHSCF